MTNKLFFLFIIGIFSISVMAGPTKVGNGNDGFDLEGFDLVTSGKLIKTREMALIHIRSLNVSGIRGLGSLIPELENSKIYLTKKNINSKRLEELGAFHSGMEGFVYARTFSRSYAATRFFPAALGLDSKQLIALHIHEALHRALPKNAKDDEKKVTKITLALVSPETSHDNVLSVVKEVIPELFIASGEEIIKIHKHSKLKNPGRLKFTANKYASSTKRDFATGITLPMQNTYDIETQFFPFGESSYAAGFGIASSYIFTERNENYFGPLELTARLLLWSKRRYDFEFKLGTKLMSSSNSKVIDSLYGRDVILAGFEANKITNEFKLKFGLDLLGKSDYERILSNVATKYEVGPLLTLYGSAYYPWKKFEFGGQFNLLSLQSIRVSANNSTLLEKGRDQYFTAGPKIIYKYNSKYGMSLGGEYLFNSNKKQDEDNLRDLFGSAMGQWKWFFSFSILFY